MAPRTLKTPDPSTIIVDGAHNGGNDDVFFLPPLVGDPSGTAGFGDPEQLGLPVEIQVNCLSKAGTSTCPNFDFQPSQVKSTSDAHYMVNWDTKAPGVDPGDVYRIEVHIGQKTIAWADVALVSTGNPKNVSTQGDIPLPDGRTMPIKIRIEKGWDCTNRSNKNQCVTQVVPNVAADGSGSTIITFAGTDLEPAGGGRFYDGWIPYSATCPAGSTTCVPTGTPVVVTIEDQTALLNSSGQTCSLKDPKTGVPVTNMLTQLGSGDAVHPGRCVKFTTNPRFQFASRVDVAVCVESPTPTQQLIKYDIGETPRFLQNVFFPILCEPTTIGSTVRERSTNKALNYALNTLARAGHALSAFFTPKSAYAIHLGVGGLIDAGDGGFSYVAPAEPYTMSKVSGDNQTGIVTTAVAGPQSRITTIHASLTPAVGQNVRCEITGGGGHLVSATGPTSVVVQTQGVTNEAGAVTDAVATCPAWFLGPDAGTNNNTLRMVALNIDDGIIAKEDNGEGGVQTQTLRGVQNFTATATAPQAAFIDFEHLPDGTATGNFADLTNQFASLGVTFNFLNANGGGLQAPSMLVIPGYDDPNAAGNHLVSSPTGPGGNGGFSSGTLIMNYNAAPGFVSFIGTVNNDVIYSADGSGVGFRYTIRAYDLDGKAIPTSQITSGAGSTYTSAAGVLFRRDFITVANSAGLSRIEIVENGFVMFVDNLRLSTNPPIE